MPAGSLERLKVAVLYGADAVYMGTPDMSLRTKSQLSLDDVKEGIRFAHREVTVRFAGETTVNGPAGAPPGEDARTLAAGAVLHSLDEDAPDAEVGGGRHKGAL